LQSGLTGLLAVGAASMLPIPTVHAQEVVSVQQRPVVVINYADLTAECERLEAECFRTLQVAAAIAEGFPALGLTDQQHRVIEAHEDALFTHHQVTMEWYVAELARHFPGLAPAFTAVWVHVREESSREPCCERA
jgi:hypothetical protein